MKTEWVFMPASDDMLERWFTAGYKVCIRRLLGNRYELRMHGGPYTNNDPRFSSLEAAMAAYEVMR